MIKHQSDQLGRVQTSDEVQTDDVTQSEIVDDDSGGQTEENRLGSRNSVEFVVNDDQTKSSSMIPEDDDIFDRPDVQQDDDDRAL